MVEPRQVVIIEPYNNFKGRLQLMRKYLDENTKIEVCKGYLYIERNEVAVC